MSCLRRPLHSAAEEIHAAAVLGEYRDPVQCAACQLDGDDTSLMEPGPNYALLPTGDFYTALVAAYRLADGRNRAALRLGFPTLGPLILAGAV